MGKILNLFLLLAVFCLTLIFSGQIKEKIESIYKGVSSVKTISIEQYKAMVKTAVDSIPVNFFEKAPSKKAPMETTEKRVPPKIIVIKQ